MTTSRILLDALAGARMDSEKNLAEAEAEAEAQATRKANADRASIERAARRLARDRPKEEIGWTVLGIDPGAHGACAMLRAWRGRERMPQLEALADTSDLVRVRQSDEGPGTSPARRGAAEKRRGRLRPEG